ncbi:winged helix-turn-helix transcriptional regulator [Paeniglutamicibacter antarcticus]|uniref:Winged helix-turn-helix transcriptional regulator n=1 Tax=Arthrobacter terrae TaxID=2935737 RepID=A0A931CUI7_9MICC|nr:MarR family winged helix-turn-helix transcriptional regulator [Arthrobacter terrae]MBG0740108.1 winged helix-turn-helix transcriptional regulator [Arthrobacter terrae]
MNYVKADFPVDQIHTPMLMGLLFRQVHAIFATEDWNGLRQSHFRVISSVPEHGVTITELGERVGMTKQGCGQFVAQLVRTGHLTSDRDPSDRRVRLVHRTPLGQQVIDAVLARNLRIEQDWAGRVGQERYRTFRGVLEELALGSLPD